MSKRRRLEDYRDELEACARAGLSVAETARKTGIPARSISYAASRWENVCFQPGQKKAAQRKWSQPDYRETMMKVCAANQSKRWEGHRISAKWEAEKRRRTLVENCFRFSKLITPSIEATVGRKMKALRLEEAPPPKKKRPATRSDGFWDRAVELLGRTGPLRTAQVAKEMGVNEKYAAQQLGFAYEAGRVARKTYRSGHAGGWMWMVPDMEDGDQ